MTSIINKIGKSSEEFIQNLQHVVSGDGCRWEEVVKKLVCHLQLLDKFIQRPWKEYNDCQEAIKQCFAMTANCYK
jgi:asparagine synthetase A